MVASDGNGQIRVSNNTGSTWLLISKATLNCPEGRADQPRPAQSAREIGQCRGQGWRHCDCTEIREIGTGRFDYE